MLVSRNPKNVAQVFRHPNSVGLSQWGSLAQDYDLFLHLAAVNNDGEGSFREYESVNKTLSGQFAEIAEKAGIRRFVYVSSWHALIPQISSPYAVTKRAGEEAARLQIGQGLETIYLGLVHGTEIPKRFSFLVGAPEKGFGQIFGVLSAIKPTTSVDLLVEHIERPSPPERGVAQTLTDGVSNNTWYKIWSIALNSLFVFAVVLLLPALALIWLAIVIEDGRPGIFRQARDDGKGGVFWCYKFRTMRLDAEDLPSHQIQSQLVTRVGRILRRLKLDELPQVLNVIRREMNLVGPRPCLTTQSDVLDARFHAGVKHFVPGITGWSQVNGIDMSDARQLASNDQTYLKLQSIWLDFKILLWTVSSNN